MNWIDTLNAAAGEWSHWMIHMSWQVAVLVPVVWLVSRLASKRSARFRHLLWVAVFLKLVLPPMLSTPWSAGNLIPDIPGAYLPVSVLQNLSSSSVPETKDVLPTLSSRSVQTFGQVRVVSETAVPSASAEPVTQMSVAAWCMIAWASIALALAAAVVWQYRRYVWLVLRHATPAPETLQAVVNAQAEQLGVTRRVPVLVSPVIHTPAVFGFLKPSILLPGDWNEQFTAGDLAGILAHEVAHIKRGDLPVTVIAAMLSCVYWFHPAVWFANLQQRREREMACDDMVLESSRQPGKAYAASLLKAAEHFTGETPAGAGFLGLLELSDNLLYRVRAATDVRRVRRMGWGSALALIALLLILPMGAWTATGLALEAAQVVTAPEIVTVTPAIGAQEVDPATTEIRVTFDQDMRTGGYSWTGGGEMFPKTTGKPEWADNRTCVLHVTLEPAKIYRVGINSKSHQNFRGVNGIPARPRAVYFATQGADPAEIAKLVPPSIVSMSPENGAIGVAPNMTELTVAFDKPMGGGFSWVTLDERFPETTDKPQWNDDHTVCTLPVSLKPDASYHLSLNSGRHINFQSAFGVPLEPVEWSFSTGK